MAENIELFDEIEQASVRLFFFLFLYLVFVIALEWTAAFSSFTQLRVFGYLEKSGFNFIAFFSEILIKIVILIVEITHSLQKVGGLRVSHSISRQLSNYIP